MGKLSKDYEQFHSGGDSQEFETLLSASKLYKKVKQVDTERTIHLVSKAKGDRNLREFGAAAKHINYTQLSRILSGTSIVIGNKGIAAIVAAAIPGSNVTLGALMEAQGRVRIDSFNDYEVIRKLTIRQILEDALISEGYEIVLKKTDSDSTKLSVELDKFGKKEGFVWSLDIMTFVARTKSIDYAEETNYLLGMLLKCSLENTGTDRYSFIIDSDQLYGELKEKAENIRVPNEVSIVLVDVAKRRVKEEFIVPLTKKKHRDFLFSETAVDEENLQNYSVKEMYKIDCRMIILNELLQKKYRLSSAKTCKDAMENAVNSITSDFSIIVREDDGDGYSRTFFARDTEEVSDYAEMREEIHAWFTHVLASFHLGFGGKVSLIIDNSQLFDAVVEDLSRFKIQDQISVILVDIAERKIIAEKNISK